MANRGSGPAERERGRKPPGGLSWWGLRCLSSPRYKFLLMGETSLGSVSENQGYQDHVGCNYPTEDVSDDLIPEETGINNNRRAVLAVT